MRIAVLTNDYPPFSSGGAGKIALEQVRMLESAGETVRVWHKQASWLGKHPLTRLLGHLLDLGSQDSLVAEITTWKPDILLTHNLTGCGFSTPRVIHQKTKVRWCHLLHDVQLFEPSGQVKDARVITPWQKGWSWLRRRALQDPDLVISPTRWLLEEHRRRGFFLSVSKEVLPNPGWNPLLRRSRELRSVHKPPHLLFIGRVSEEKGANLLRFLAAALPMELHVVGDGPSITAVRAVSLGVTCYGTLTSDLVESQLKAADAVLVPSQIEENQPTVILEAAAFGLPVIASRKGGIPETLQGAGILCPADDPAAWVRAIQELEDPETYERYSEAMETVAARHDPAVYTQRLIELLASNR